MNSGVRVSIPNNVRKTIQNIKEITGNHSEDEIYAMLKECSMDPNETVPKLLSQDPFHEVRRKRDRRKEITNKESTEPSGKPGMQGRGNRGGRGNYSSRHISHEKPDAGSSKTAFSAKEYEIIRVADDGVAPQDKNKETSVVASSSTVAPDKLSDPVAEKTSTVPLEANKILTGRDVSVSKTLSPKPGAYLSASDPILMPSQDSRLPAGTIRLEVGGQRTPVDQVKETTPAEIKTASVPEVVMFQGEGNKLLSESSRPIGRPPSNYNNRLQQAIGPQKVGPGKEWKPKPTNPISVETHSSTNPASSIPDSKDATSEKESQISGGQHVIIPNHLHVPEAEKLGFQFGSFDATFGVNSISLSGPMTDKSPSLSEASQEIIEHIEEHPTRHQDVEITADDGDSLDHRPSSSSNVPENLSSNVTPEPIESKEETSLPIAGHQYPAAHPSNLNFGFVPPIIGSQLAPFENNESQVPDVSLVPSFVIQQPFDPSGYYSQFFRSGADNDGRVSPFHQPGKYNGNAPSQASQSSQEVGNSVMLSGTGQTPFTTQAGGMMQSSIVVTQQPLPVFRQPTGIQLPHYPPNYIPYAPYFPQFYMPPPAIHQFLSNGAFPQQPQGGYPSPQVSPQKYPLPQYKPGSNTPNSGHVGVPGTFGLYGSSPAAGYNPNPAATAGNSSSNEDLGGSQFKEYATGAQSEGPGVWIAAPGRDIPGSFYNLPQGGQVAYNPTQIPHGTFNSIYHPGQPVTTGSIHPLLQHPQTMAGGVDMVGPTSSPYPQPQPTQINWPNNY